MAGPRKATIVSKLQNILKVLKSATYKEAIKLSKATTKVESLVSSIADGVKADKKPKKTTEYQLFVKSESKKIKAANPSMKQSDVLSKVAELWREKKPAGSKAPVKKPAAKKPAAKK